MAESRSQNIVDLAGSERSDKTGATGARLKEGSRAQRITWRQLQDHHDRRNLASCINYEETLGTLQFAARAADISTETSETCRKQVITQSYSDAVEVTFETQG